MRASMFLAFAVLFSCTVAPTVAEGHPRSPSYSLEVVSEGGARLPTFHHQGREYVLGGMGARYLLRVRNHTGRRIEVVASVDGRDVLDGKPASWGKRGYLVHPYGETVIDGFRLNDASVAAFRFSAVSRSYAARMGNARDVGVLGVAIFPERSAPRIVHAPPQSSWARDEAEEKAGAGAPSASAEASAQRRQRGGLGTEFGEEHTSHVSSVHFERESDRPATVLTVRYNDRAGLLAAGVDVDGDRRLTRQDLWLRETADPFRSNGDYAQPPPGWRR